MRAPKSITVSFTLLNSDPDSVLAEWDIESVVQKYLDPFLLMVPHLDITVDSQILHYSGIKINPRKDGESFYLSYDDLPHMINPIEAKLGSHISLYPSLNFVVYVPSQKHTPLHMKTKDGEQSSSNAFLSPQWGGIMIYKSTEDCSREQHKTTADSCGYEACYAHIPLTTQAVVGLDACGKNSNTVVGHWYGLCQQQLLKTETWLQQFSAAKKAIRSSEEAFFDPSILELLYFPDDQKYAIYIPLFLPISLPVLLSLRQAINWYRGKDNTDEKDEDKDKQD
ncbi:hypothetical protein OS493_016008 [Desmophyllum pertusum]|uniref:Uncharacterized protein n=1 Tax=Desmophyllum pertusum TaxID=174260 RepID=A0A9W9YCU5_9CNID|nr:hypothetical protein OS493_016008 [Desmophyllum pertusum]